LSSASASFTSDRSCQTDRSSALNIESGGQTGSPFVDEQSEARSAPIGRQSTSPLISSSDDAEREADAGFRKVYRLSDPRDPIPNLNRARPSAPAGGIGNNDAHKGCGSQHGMGQSEGFPGTTPIIHLTPRDAARLDTGAPPAMRALRPAQNCPAWGSSRAVAAHHSRSPTQPAAPAPPCHRPPIQIRGAW